MSTSYLDDLNLAAYAYGQLTSYLDDIDLVDEDLDAPIRYDILDNASDAEVEALKRLVKRLARRAQLAQRVLERVAERRAQEAAS